MADRPFNVALGRAIEYFERVRNNDPATSQIVVMLLQTTQGDAVLSRHRTFEEILLAANAEADFDNYARQFLTDADLSAPAVDDVNDQQDIDVPDITINNAGSNSGGTNNTLAKAVFGYDRLGTNQNANIIPIGHADYTRTTDGNPLTIEINAAGLYRARHTS